jgi:hypothetical protein
VEHESLVIVLSAGGADVATDALAALGAIRVQWARIEREGDAACLAARVAHAEAPEDFRARVRRWGAARGWSVTVAPGRPLR